jgi:photosystem II stability/assembly factor-like uncharacterized protein
MKKILLIISLVFIISSVAQAQSSAWEILHPLPQGNDLNSVYFSDANTGYAVGGMGTILKTSDGGATWVIQNSGITTYLNAVVFTDANTGYAVGGLGKILKTINGGANWTAQISNVNTTDNLNSVYFTSADTGYVAGINGSKIH